MDYCDWLSEHDAGEGSIQMKLEHAPMLLHFASFHGTCHLSCVSMHTYGALKHAHFESFQ